MADQTINALSTKTAPETSDQLLLVGAGEPQLIDYDKLADAILNKITSKNYALDAGQMTLLAALNKLNSDMVGKIHALSTDCGYLYFRKSADAVSVFGTLKVINQNNIDDYNIGEIPDFLNPNYDYAVLSAITNYIPYIPVGTLWIYRDGKIKLYHNAENTDIFVFGSYIIDRS